VRSLGLSGEHALEIVSREPNTPATRADLEVGDIIVAAQSHPIDGVDALHRFLSRWSLGDTLRLSVLRRTRLFDIEVVPVEMPKD
jgi:S1-C subfamily serine protease